MDITQDALLSDVNDILGPDNIFNSSTRVVGQLEGINLLTQLLESLNLCTTTRAENGVPVLFVPVYGELHSMQAMPANVATRDRELTRNILLRGVPEECRSCHRIGHGGICIGRMLSVTLHELPRSGHEEAKSGDVRHLGQSFLTGTFSFFKTELLETLPSELQNRAATADIMTERVLLRRDFGNQQHARLLVEPVFSRGIVKGFCIWLWGTSVDAISQLLPFEGTMEKKGHGDHIPQLLRHGSCGHFVKHPGRGVSPDQERLG